MSIELLVYSIAVFALGVYAVFSDRPSRRTKKNSK